MRNIQPLAQDHVTLLESPDPERVFTYSPGICRLESGRLVATLDLGGPGMAQWPDPTTLNPKGKPSLGKVLTSDDGGRTWTHRADFPFMHARPFVAGAAVYILGQCGDLRIVRSDDGGETWSASADLTRGEIWHQAPCNVHYANGCVYLVMEKRQLDSADGKPKYWPVSLQAPVLMRAAIDDDLTRPENWTLASEMFFYDVIDPDALDGYGVPFFPVGRDHGVTVAPGRGMAPIGWLEANVVHIGDPDHVWHDPTGKTFHIWSRTHTGGTGYAAICKVVEQGDKPGTGEMKTLVEQAPSGRTMFFVPCPGGQMKFHVLQDPQTGLFWLLSTQATNSMTRPERLPDDRYNLPNNERRRLQLHFSKNMIDWCFAGLVAVGPEEKASRHYASMAIDGDDLVVLSRSGDERAKSAHDGNLITFHRIEKFRELVY